MIIYTKENSMRYHNYIFFTTHPKFQDLPNDLLEQYKKEFLKQLTDPKEVVINTYTTLGLKKNTKLLIWFQSDTIENIQNLLNQLMHTSLGKHLKITHTLLGITRPSQYSKLDHQDTNRKGAAYLIIYPFTKTPDWYLLDLEKRKELMNGHIAIGRKYPQISQLLLYSFGLDDQEFIVSYETENLPDFQNLVMDLRSDQVRAYTQKDTPIFTCIYKPAAEVLEFL